MSYFYPKPRKENIVDDYFGVKVEDPYRWMENENDNELKEWIKKQNNLLKEYLSNIDNRGKIKNRLKQLNNYNRYISVFTVGEYIFYEKNDGTKNQNVFYYQKGIKGKEEVFLDPNEYSNDGTVSIEFLKSSNDKKYIPFAISESGSDWKEIRIIEIETKRILTDSIKWVKSTNASWYKNGFFYSRYNKPEIGKEYSSKNKDLKIYYHNLGDDQEKDELIYEDENNPLRFNMMIVSENEKYFILYVSEGTYGNEISIKKSGTNDDFKSIFKGFSSEHTYVGDKNDNLIFSTDLDAPNKKLIEVDPRTFIIKTLIEEKDMSINFVNKVCNKLIINYNKDVNSYPLLYSLEGTLERKISLPDIGTTYSYSGERDSNYFHFIFTNFLTPPSIYLYDIEDNKIIDFKKADIKFNQLEFETNQIFYESKDGTKIPMFLTHKKSMKKNGKNPTLLWAYGGFNISLPPVFDPLKIFLFENDFIYAQANIRGGGEYGEKWHKSGMLFNKKNVFNDFICAAEYLIEKNYTNKNKLAIEGRSNGGLLIGAVINQRPDLFKVAFPIVGVLDMLRYHKYTIGWAWTVEYGSSEEEKHFKNIFSYSPLHNINKNAEYPAILVLTADHDDRVVPAHSFKYIATIQEKLSGKNPYMIRIDSKSGHGMGKSIEKILEETTDKYTFMFNNLEI